MALSFDQIPASVRTPDQFIEVSNALAVQSAQRHVALAIGQRLSTGSVAEAVPTLVPSPELGETYFGIGSHVAEMCRVFKKVAPTVELWVIAVDDAGGGVANTRTLTFTNTATAAGVIYLYIGGRRITVSIASGAVQNDIAAAVNTAIQAHLQYARMPFTSGVATNVVTLTARNKGTVTNEVDVRINYQQGESLPTAVALAIAVGTPGSTDPVISTALDVVGDVQYHTIFTSFSTQTPIDLLVTHQIAKWDAMTQQDGHAYFALDDTLSNLTTAGALYNSPYITQFEIGGVVKGSPTPNFIAAANIAAVGAFQTTLHPARPLQTLPLSEVLPPAAGDQFDRTERETLLNIGVATHKIVGREVQIERMITTYQTSPAGAEDISYLDSETLRTLAFLRWDTHTLLSLKYPRHMLADDGTLYDPGTAVVTPSTVKAELIARARIWERNALIENIEQFKTDLLVERDGTDNNRLNYRLVPDLMNGFRVGAGQIQFIG